MSLYELTSEMVVIEQQLLDSGGEASEALFEYLDGLDVRIEEKIERICYVIRNAESMASAIKDEEMRMRSRRASYESTVERLKSSLRDAMMRLEKKKVVTPKFTVNYQKSGRGRLLVDDVDSLPDAFVNKKVEIKPDDKKIREAIANGESIRGVRIDEQKTILRIR